MFTCYRRRLKSKLSGVNFSFKGKSKGSGFEFEITLKFKIAKFELAGSAAT